MNIFYVDSDPYIAAQGLCDKHVVKMILETAQLLSTAHRVLDGDIYADTCGLYKTTHKNHPCAVWVRESYANYLWAYNHLLGLLGEYLKRYDKVHKTDRLTKFLGDTPTMISLSRPFTEPPKCMPDKYKALSVSTTEAYRLYLMGEKAHFSKWNHGPKPSWWVI